MGPPPGQVPLGRSVAQVNVIGDVQLFETIEGAVNGALADVGVGPGNDRDYFLGAAVAFSLDQGGDHTPQPDCRAPSGLPHRPDSRVNSGLTS